MSDPFSSRPGHDDDHHAHPDGGDAGRLAPVPAALFAAVADESGAGRADALGELGQASFEAGDLDVALAAAEEAADLYLEHDRPGGAACATHNASVTLRALGRLDEAIERHREAIDLHRFADDVDDVAVCRVHLAELLLEQGDDKAATAELRSVLELAEPHPFQPDLGPSALGALSVAAALLARRATGLGAAKEAEQHLEQARWWGEVGAPVEHVGALHLATADLFLVTDRFAEAVACAERARAVFDALGDDDGVRTCDIRIAEALAFAGDAKAPDRILALRAEDRSEGRANGVAGCDRMLGRFHLVRGELDEALRLADAAVTVHRACGDFVSAAKSDLLRIEVVLAGTTNGSRSPGSLSTGGEDMLAEAARMVGLIIDVLVDDDFPMVATRARVVAAEVLLLTGQHADAERHLHEAWRVLRRSPSTALKRRAAAMRKHFAGRPSERRT